MARGRATLLGVSASPGPHQAATELEAVRRVLDDLRRQVSTALDDLDARIDALGAAQSASPAYHRPAPVPPRRMEQMTRTPAPTADLDDLVVVLAPRLVEHLVPALREALKDVR